MRVSPEFITIDTDVKEIERLLMELILRPRRDLIRWARLTKQTPNMRIGYPGQHIASLVTGVEGARTAARGHDLSDGSEVKSCSRVDQLDKCNRCRAAVARIEATCPRCGSDSIRRSNDSKWLITVRSEAELASLLDVVPRILLILSDYPNIADEDWNTIQFQVFEIWPQAHRHKNFRTLMENYLRNIFNAHIARQPNKTPAPKNLWPYSYQFYMCNPVLTFHCVATNAIEDPKLEVMTFVDPTEDRQNVETIPMPLSILTVDEREVIREQIGQDGYNVAVERGLDEFQRLDLLTLRDTDYATPQKSIYIRGVR